MNRHYSIECPKFDNVCNKCDHCILSTFAFPINKITTQFHTMPHSLGGWEEEIRYMFSTLEKVSLKIKESQRVTIGKSDSIISVIEVKVKEQVHQMRVTPITKYLPFLGNYSPKPLQVNMMIYKEKLPDMSYYDFAWRHFESSGLEKSRDAALTVCYCFFNTQPKPDHPLFQKLPKGKMVVIGIVGLTHSLLDNFEVLQGTLFPPLEDLHSLRFRKFLEGISHV